MFASMRTVHFTFNGSYCTWYGFWLAFGLIYRWSATRLTDAQVDAALTRFAWPGYRLTQRWRGRDVGPLRPV